MLLALFRCTSRHRFKIRRVSCRNPSVPRHFSCGLPAELAMFSCILDFAVHEQIHAALRLVTYRLVTYCYEGIIVSVCMPES